MLIIIFGLAGTGKNYVGNILKEKFHYQYHDADLWLTSEMNQAILQKQVFTQKMRDDYTNVIISEIKKNLKRNNENIATSQALYKESNRKMILEAFEALPIIFLQIDSSPEVIRRRLLKRNGAVWVEYANDISKNFEPMKESNICKIIENDIDGPHYIMSQLSQVFITK